MSYSIKSIKKEFSDRGIFYTPEALALTLKSYVDVDSFDEVYDPTCGGGNLLAVFPDDVKKYGQEINSPQAIECRERLTNCEIAIGDTLKEPAFLGKKFKVIVANPPFGIKWQPSCDERFFGVPTLPPPSKADYAFILHCLHYLADDGVAVIMDSRGILFRAQREGEIRKWLIEQNYIDKVVYIPGGQFEDTAIATCLLVLKKNRSTTDIQFQDLESERDTSATLDEIRKNGYVLDLSHYFPQIKKQQEGISIADLKENLKTQVSQILDANFQLLKLLDGLDGGCEFSQLKVDVKNILDKYDAI